MKFTLILSLSLLSFYACSKEAAKKEVSKTRAATVKTEAPCDTKEDIIKKLEEEKKAKEEKGKGFSLQGGNTGCTVK